MHTLIELIDNLFYLLLENDRLKKHEYTMEIDIRTLSMLQKEITEKSMYRYDATPAIMNTHAGIPLNIKLIETDEFHLKIH